MSEETVVLNLIRPEDLNHHRALLAGQMTKWLVKTVLMAV